MKILSLHNYYQQAGGEDTVFAAEAALLRQKGHTVEFFTATNDELKVLSTKEKITQSFWSKKTYQELQTKLREFQPDVAHFHNTFFRISPSAYDACFDAQIPVVQTLHNYRLLCSGALFFRDGEICEDCSHWHTPLPGIIHRCYRHSLSETVAMTGIIQANYWRKTWQNKVDTYIALTEFSRQKFIRQGFAPEKIMVKPNFVDSAFEQQSIVVGGYALYLGRLSEEKGIRTLLAAWQNLSVPLKIAGTGPLKNEVEAAAQKNPFIFYLGQVDHEEIKSLIQKSSFLVFPSECYETFGQTIVEAFAGEKPVLAADLPVRAEFIEDGINGLLYKNRTPTDLAQKALWLWEHPREVTEMGLSALRVYRRKYTPERNYLRLIEIYEKTIQKKGQK